MVLLLVLGGLKISIFGVVLGFAGGREKGGVFEVGSGPVFFFWRARYVLWNGGGEFAFDLFHVFYFFAFFFLDHLSDCVGFGNTDAHGGTF